jgi:sarcosine/dimethylglycine N-methyltransferase
MEEVGFEDHSGQLPLHHARVPEETEAREAELSAEISTDYIERMKKGLGDWV